MIRSKVLVSRAVSRRLATVVAVLAIGVIAAGCHGAGASKSSGYGGLSPGPAAQTAGPSAGPAGQSKPAPAVSLGQTKPFTGPAAVKYGQARLRAAYREMVIFAYGTGWNETLIHKSSQSLTHSDFDRARTYLTAACAKAFDAELAKVAQHDKAAIRTLEGAVLVGVRGVGGLTPITGTPAVTDRKVSSAVVGIDQLGGTDRLTMAFTASATIQMRNAAGMRYTVSTKRQLRYLLVPNTSAGAADQPFLIAAWTNQLSSAAPKVVN